MHDLIIIGAGPAGLTAAVYAARYKMDQRIITREVGGTAATADTVCNFPSYDRIKGFELMQKMSAQVEKLSVPITYDGVSSITRSNDHFIITTENGDHYESRKVLYCAGTVHNKLHIPGEEEFLGRGVSYCATCDGAFYKNKTVAVIGGSDAALTAALLLSEFATKVSIIYRKDKFLRAEPAWVEAVEKESKITALFNTEISQIHGARVVTGVQLNTGSMLSVDGVFIEIGSTPKTDLLGGLGVALDKGYVVVNTQMESTVQGFYAAGDVVNHELKQIVTACSDGATAVYAIYHALKKSQ